LAPTLPTIDEVQKSSESVYRVMPPTPQYCWPLLGERLGAEVWVKHENQTPTGSFKARTAVVYAEELRKREPGTRGLNRSDTRESRTVGGLGGEAAWFARCDCGAAGK